MRTDLMAFAIDSEVSGYHILKDVWSAGIDSELPRTLSKVCNREDRTLRYTEILT